MPKPRLVSTGRSTEVRCYLEPSSARKFKEHFPDRSSFSWALQTAVDAIVAMVDGTPTNRDLIEGAIRDAVIAQRLKLKQAKANERDSATSSEGDRSSSDDPGQRVTVEPI